MKIYILVLLLFISSLNTSLFAGATSLKEVIDTKELKLLRTMKSKSLAGEAVEKLEGEDDSLVTPSTRQSGELDLAYALFENTILVLPYLRWMRNEFIEKVATPNFFSISYMGRPLNIYIFPTLHTLPVTVIPPYIRNMIYAIASAKNSILYTEILGEDDDSDDEDNESIFLARDPREILDIEKVMQRELNFYAVYARNIYVQAEEDSLQLRRWEEARECKENKLRDIFEKGWTNGLSDEAKEMFLEIDSCALDRLNNTDPLCFYYRIANIALHEFRPFIYGLDSEILDIFSKKPREIRGLEIEEDRVDAFEQELWQGTEAYDDEKFLPLDSILKLSNDKLGKLIRYYRLQESLDEDDYIYYPNLDEINFSEPMVYSYMLGKPYQSRVSFAVNQRNNQWWEDTIFPLLSLRSNQKHSFNMQNMAPILLVYGAGHNEGPSSILNHIRNLNGFRLHILTRHGFEKL